ncbi:sigma-70 family RNA polymerase sigma factor [Viridibacillus sp. YIM B01967]|uniref:Sigma-70 family RNA polymerase sigma factor n=1 Tax=Viridibacillus soli TaxID=2798301 RepID=A0ABS1HAI5_9BACL|nr:sigma-70 family RNA polymerase sigma factor [Viridibacillus soli]MBK3496122.1 sigma-70 family RNA polymerase sigma factor [Viridibacillus soli]
MKATANDYEIMEELYNLYEQKMYQVAYSILHNVQQAEDVVQETFILLLENIHKINDIEDHKTKSFVLKSTKNKAIDYYRSNKRSIEMFNKFKEVPQEDTCDNVTQKIQRLITKEQQYQLLETLSMIHKEIIKYLLFYELTTKETAEILGISEGTVRKRYERAKKVIIKNTGGKTYETLEE